MRQLLAHQSDKMAEFVPFPSGHDCLWSLLAIVVNPNWDSAIKISNSRFNSPWKLSQLSRSEAFQLFEWPNFKFNRYQSFIADFFLFPLLLLLLLIFSVQESNLAGTSPTEFCQARHKDALSVRIYYAISLHRIITYTRAIIASIFKNDKPMD